MSRDRALGISRRKFYELLPDGKIPSVGIIGRRVPREALCLSSSRCARRLNSTSPSLPARSVRDDEAEEAG